MMLCSTTESLAQHPVRFWCQLHPDLSNSGDVNVGLDRILCRRRLRRIATDRSLLPDLYRGPTNGGNGSWVSSLYELSLATVRWPSLASWVDASGCGEPIVARRSCVAMLIPRYWIGRSKRKFPHWTFVR